MRNMHAGTDPVIASEQTKQAQSALVAEEHVEQMFGGKYYPSLAKLDLSRKALSEIPQGVFSLSNLRELDLGKNALVKIPEEIGELTSLRKYAEDGRAHV